MSARFIDDSDMERMSPICSLCSRHNQRGRRCEAYPELIPDEIWYGRNDHTSPYPGDNGLQFVKRAFPKSD